MSLQSAFQDRLIEAHRAKAWRWDGTYQPGECPVCAEVPVPNGDLLTMHQRRNAMTFYSQHDGTAFERPEDAANYDYYNFDMKTRRFRVVYEVEVEWRPDNPDFAINNLRVLLNTTDARDAKFISAQALNGGNE